MNSSSTQKLNDAPKQENAATGKCTDPRCIETLELLIDGQASEEEERFIQEHMQSCMPCYRKYNLEKTIKDVLVLKVEKRKVPAELINKIKDSIKATTE